MASSSKNMNSQRLLDWKELEPWPWMKDNEYILTGYRQVSASYKASIRSIFEIHNETVNIWSHLLGAIFFIVYLFELAARTRPSLAHASSSDVLAISTYYLAVINCFLLSTGFHIFSNHSRFAHKLGNELDYLGIVLVIYGSSISATYFQFYCDSFKRRAYWALSSTFAAGSVTFTLRSNFRQPTYRRTRFYMYSLLGLSCFIPVIHGILTVGYRALDDLMSVTYLFSLAFIQFSGGAIYIARIPERLWPNKFINSHQIMHIVAIIGAKVYEKGLLEAAARWSEGFNSCPT